MSRVISLPLNCIIGQCTCNFKNNIVKWIILNVKCAMVYACKTDKNTSGYNCVLVDKNNLIVY